MIMNSLNFHDMFSPDPNKETITEGMHLEKEWFEKAKKIKTLEDLTQFVSHMLNDYNHDYGTCCHAIAACAVASASLGAHIEAITGFQAGFVMWDFIRYWIKESNECGLRLVDYDDFLYPQYEDKYKTIDKDVWEKLQQKATDNLIKDKHACPEVRQHWINIAKGIVPFGYKINQ